MCGLLWNTLPLLLVEKGCVFQEGTESTGKPPLPLIDRGADGGAGWRCSNRGGSLHKPTPRSMREIPASLIFLSHDKEYLPKTETNNIRTLAICPWMTDTIMAAGIRELWVMEGLPLSSREQVGRIIVEVAADEESNGKAIFCVGSG